MKKLKYLFILIISLFIFIPKDTFAQTYKGVHYYYGSDPVFSNYLNTNGTTELLNLTFSNNLNFSANTNTNYLLNIPVSISFSYSTVTTYGETYAVNDLINYSSFQFYIVGDNNNTWIPGTFENGILQFVVPGGKIYHKLYARYTSGYAIPQDSSPIYSIALNSGITYYELDGNQNIISGIQEQTEATKEQTEATKEQTETIKDKDTSESQEEASGFFDDFENDDYGLSDIITMPLSFIRGLSNSVCYPLNIPLPFVDTNITLPCMTSIYSKHFGSFLTLYQTITTGIIAYWCCINIFRMVQGFKDPESDQIEVMDL